MTELLLEMSRIGVIDGWSIDMYSNDHNPPHFHFGPVRVAIPDAVPKNVTELRQYVFKNEQSKVSDKQLTNLLKMLQGKTSHGGEMLTFMKDLWSTFDILRPKSNTLNEEVDEAISEMLEVAGCNENERKNK